MADWSDVRNSIKNASSTPREDDDVGMMMMEYPLLAQFLGRYVDDTGRVVIGGTLLLFCDTGKLKACLSDKYSQRKAFISLAPGEDPCRQVEALLQANQLDWRADKARR